MVDDDWNVGNSSDGFSMNTEEVDSSSVESSRFVEKKGFYHFEISDTKEKYDLVNNKGNSVSPYIGVNCIVLESVPGQAPSGSIYYHRIQVAGKGGAAPDQWQIDSTTTFLYGVGILKKSGDKIIDPVTGSTNIDIKTIAKRLKGLQFIGNIRCNKDKNGVYPDRYELTMGQGAFTVDHEAVADVPKNQSALALIGKSQPAAPTPPPAAPAESQATKTSNGTATSTPDDNDDLDVGDL